MQILHKFFVQSKLYYIYPELYKSTKLTQSLTDVFTELGALIAALHRTNQLAREPAKKVNVCYTDEAAMVS